MEILADEYPPSQICNLLWSKNSNELVSTHGFSAGHAQNQGTLVPSSKPTLRMLTTISLPSNSLHLYASTWRLRVLVSVLTFLCSQGATELIRNKSLLFRVTATESCTSPCRLRCVQAQPHFLPFSALTSLLLRRARRCTLSLLSYRAGLYRSSFLFTAVSRAPETRPCDSGTPSHLEELRRSRRIGRSSIHLLGLGNWMLEWMNGPTLP